MKERRPSGEPVLAEVGPPVILSLGVAGYLSVRLTLAGPGRRLGNDGDMSALVDDLRRVANGDVAVEIVLAKYERSGLSAFAAIWHGLQHYMADADIRAKDSGYRQMQEAELATLIRLLEEGAPEAELRRITFLGRSRE